VVQRKASDMKPTVPFVLLAIPFLAMSNPGCHPHDGPGETNLRPAAASALVGAVDARRSLVATEQIILDRFPFQRVLDQLVADSGVPGLTSLGLFRQWWDTQNPQPGLGLGAHCNDQVNGSGAPTLNSYPYGCRPAPSEGGEASADPFAEPLATNPASYLPIGVFMRPDLARKTTGSCGEYRLVYARRSGLTSSSQRNLIIFEGYMPNARQDGRLRGCAELFQWVADLSDIDDPDQRGALLEQLFFQGVAGYPPVLEATHFGDNPHNVGQIRTNQFLDAPGFTWTLREFKLLRSCTGQACSAMRVTPVTDKMNPFGPLFGDPAAHPRANEFQTSEPNRVVARLALPAFDSANVVVPDRFNTGQSQASGSTENNYLTQFAAAPAAFRNRIQQRLTSAGSSLTPENVVGRLQALSCAGCHRFNNNLDLGGGIVWPPSLGFTHVTETQTETVDGQVRFLLSPALLDVFLPARKALLESVLGIADPEPPEPDATLGGRETH
jgi:hypothetical protein